uniref:Reverse transcriptase Ty1/copia-type domain-containing protein n=1 Tax=Solanum lycopersicum TaxID=4081 RepID=A0A3Q7FPJ7_SOLLC
MKDLGPARQILGMQIVRDRKAKKLVLSQEKYIQKVLRRFSMDKAKGSLFFVVILIQTWLVMLILASLLQEAELIAVVEACKELLWMKRFLGELGCVQERRFTGSLRKSFGAHHCCSLLVLQAAKAKRKNGEEGKQGLGNELVEERRRMKKIRDSGSFV